MLNVCLQKPFIQNGHILYHVSLKVHCFKWQDNFVYSKSIKIKAMLLIISLSFVVLGRLFYQSRVIELFRLYSFFLSGSAN